MAKERLYLFDTTMRDGALTTGVDFSLDDKRRIAAMLDRLGVDYVEGGYPGANPLDTEFFKKKPTNRARFCAFGMTKRPGRSAANAAMSCTKSATGELVVPITRRRPPPSKTKIPVEWSMV